MASTNLSHQGCVHVSSACQSRPTVKRSAISIFSRPVNSSATCSPPTAPQRCGGKTNGALLPTTSRGCACRSSEELFTLAATGPSGVQVRKHALRGMLRAPDVLGPQKHCFTGTRCAAQPRGAERLLGLQRLTKSGAMKARR